MGPEQLAALARSSPAGLGFVDGWDPDRGESDYLLPAHIDLLNQRIRQLALGELAHAGYRGMIFTVPPRHGKSFEVSQYTPAWFLGNFPDRNVALASYEADFAATWGQRSREVLERQGHLFGVEVDPSSRAASHWRVRQARFRGRPKYGSMVTTGIGGPLTGRGVDLLIVDDPVKNHKEAHSKAKRKAVWDWWTSTAATRLEPGAFILIIMTRWHEDDLAGRLLSEMKAGTGWRFLHVNLAAQALAGDPLGREVGEALWAERYPNKELDAIRTALGSYVWNSLYQGKPTSREGGMFDTDWLPVVQNRPAAIRRAVRYWDLAATEDSGDYTAGLRIELLDNGLYCISDVRRGQLSPGNVEELVQRTAEKDGPGVPIWFEQERGAAGKSLIDGYKRRLRGYKVRGQQETGIKEVRAQPLSAKAEAGGVVLLAGDWNDDFIEEAVVFPHGGNDDQVDAASGGFAKLQKGGQVTTW